MVLAADDSEDSHLHGDLLHLALFKWLHLFLCPQTDLSFSSAQSAGKVEGKENSSRLLQSTTERKSQEENGKKNPNPKENRLKSSPSSVLANGTTQLSELVLECQTLSVLSGC